MCINNYQKHYLTILFIVYPERRYQPHDRLHLNRSGSVAANRPHLLSQNQLHPEKHTQAAGRTYTPDEQCLSDSRHGLCCLAAGAQRNGNRRFGVPFDVRNAGLSIFQVKTRCN